MTTFHTLEEAIKEFDEKFYSIPDKTCLWHRNVDLRQFLSLVWQSAYEQGQLHPCHSEACAESPLTECNADCPIEIIRKEVVEARNRELVEKVEKRIQKFYDKHQDCVGERLSCNHDRDIEETMDRIISLINK